jgi:hypothetical protein
MVMTMYPRLANSSTRKVLHVRGSAEPGEYSTTGHRPARRSTGPPR